MDIFVIAPGDEAFLWKECYVGGYICIGWDEGNPQVDVFVDQIKVGDIVLAKKGTGGIVGIGIVLSDYISQSSAENPRKDKEYSRIRLVNWIKEFDPPCQFDSLAVKAVTHLHNPDQKARLDKFINVNNGLITMDQLESESKQAVIRWIDDVKAKKEKEMLNLLTTQKQIILQGPPGTGKTYLAEKLARLLLGSSAIKGENWNIVQFHPAYTYEDFVRGIRVESKKDEKDQNYVSYTTKNGILGEFAAKANKKENEGSNFVLIIDEINRANLAGVLGELIYGLEYRGEPVATPYEIEGSRSLVIPKNLYIIGTLNTADRSIGHMDYAIRRRFSFIECPPRRDVLGEHYIKPGHAPLLKKAEYLFDLVEKIFKVHLSQDFSASDVQIGHSYFMAGSEEELNMKLKYQIKPILNEYLRDGVLRSECEVEIRDLAND